MPEHQISSLVHFGSCEGAERSRVGWLNSSLKTSDRGVRGGEGVSQALDMEPEGVGAAHFWMVCTEDGVSGSMREEGCCCAGAAAAAAAVVVAVAVVW